ncbi:WD40 repeat-like protein [Suillus weaverae]|nr:WD40 repeat-like protein [Suillus weaverae]
MTLKGHGLWIRSISYFPDGQRMISGSYDKTTRQWDLKAGKEIKEARDVCEEVWAVTVSRDSRWVVTGGGDHDRPELKASEVETGIVKKLRGHSQDITCVNISADNTLLASGSWDETTGRSYFDAVLPRSCGTTAAEFKRSYGNPMGLHSTRLWSFLRYFIHHGDTY